MDSLNCEPDPIDDRHGDDECHDQQRTREKDKCQSQPFPHPLAIRVDAKADETTTGAEQQTQPSDPQQTIDRGDCRIGNGFLDDGFDSGLYPRGYPTWGTWPFDGAGAVVGFTPK